MVVEDIKKILFENGVGSERVHIAQQIRKAFNQWLEEQGANHRVKCPHCNWSQVYDGEAIAMSPCNECNSTGYTFKSLRLEAE